MLARWRSPPPRLRSDPAGPDGGPTTGEGPVGVPAGNLSDLGPEGGGPVGDEGLRGPPLGVLLVLIGGGANFAMREGCIGPLSAAGVDGCEGLWRSENCAGSLSGARVTAGEDAIESFLAFIVDPGAVKFRPPRPTDAPGPRGPDGVSGDGALAGVFRRPKVGSEGPVSRLSRPRGSFVRSRPPAREARGPVGVSCSGLNNVSRLESCLPLTLLSDPTAGAGARSSCLASLSRLRLVSLLGRSEINAARAGLITGSMFALAP
jgi:hypothetical protein